MIIPRRRAISVLMLDRNSWDFVQMLCGALDAFFQGGGGLVDCALGNRHEAHHVGQVIDRAFEPAFLREATLVAVLGEYAVGEVRRRQGGSQVVGVADGVGVAEGNDRFDDASVGGQFQAEAGFGLRFDGARWHVLGLDDDGGAAWDGDDDVGAQAGLAGDGLGVLGADLAAGHHVL